jgi:ElaA protein
VSEPTFTWRAFDELSGREVYDLLALRSQIFVVEQASIYLDADGHDQASRHLLAHVDGSTGARELAGALRVLPPGEKMAEPSIGRVVVARHARGAGLGRRLFAEGLRGALEAFGAQPIRIAAQARLERFYATFGFETVSRPYDEDGILHVDMRLEPARGAGRSGEAT